MFTSTCPSEVQISQGLGPFFKIELLKTGRSTGLLERLLSSLRTFRCCHPSVASNRSLRNEDHPVGYKEQHASLQERHAEQRKQEQHKTERNKSRQE